MLNKALETLELNAKENIRLTDIKKSSRKLILKYHPDVNPQNQLWAKEKTQAVLNAYQYLENNYFKSDNMIYDKASNSFKDYSKELEKKLKHEKEINKFSLLFEIGPYNFALPIKTVTQVLKYSKDLVVISALIEFNRLLADFIGFYKWHNKCVPLFNPAKKFNITSDVLFTQKNILIANHQEQFLALLIDRADKVKEIDRSKLEPFPGSKTNKSNTFLFDLESLF
ncbi:chemotaxis protein CheW [Candidatus Margulisiibacteriota bacterium]